MARNIISLRPTPLIMNLSGFSVHGVESSGGSEGRELGGFASLLPEPAVPIDTMTHVCPAVNIDLLNDPSIG